MRDEDLAFAGIARQAELVRSGEVSPVELVELCLARIAALDPALNAFRVVFAERALAEARQADGRRGAGSDRPLLGVPVAIKDNIDVAGESSPMGTRQLPPPAAADAEAVRRLRAAGAIVIGKTHLSELAVFPWTETMAWGVTRNAWDPARTAGGSSGGSGTAVAAGLVGAAYASDGGGSIRIPAAVNGLVGLKPQRGRVSLMPDPQHWYGLSQVGSVTRTVLDTAIWLDAVAGPAPGDAHSAPAPERPFAESARTAPGRLRIAVSTKPATATRVDPLVRRAVDETAAALRALGHDVREADPDYGLLQPLFGPRWFAGIHDDAQRLPDPRALERRNRMLARAGRLMRGAPLERALAGEAGRARQINRIFDDHDLLLTPTIPMRPWELGRVEGRSLGAALAYAGAVVAYTTQWNVTGQPAASIPSPVTDGGVPIGVQLVARPGDEATILSLAAQLEAEIGWPERRPPAPSGGSAPKSG